MIKRCLFIIFLIQLISISLYGEEVLHIKWGEPPHHINYFTTPDGIYGVSDFYVDGDEIGILNSFNESIDIFEKGTYRYSISGLPPESILIERMGNKTYIITRSSSVYLLQNGYFLNIQKMPEVRNISGIYISDNTFYPLSNYEKYNFNDILMDAIIENPHLAQIRIYKRGDIIVYSISTREEIAAITPVGLIDDLLVIETEFDGGLLRKVITLDRKGNVYSEIKLPNRFMLSDIRDVRVFNRAIFILASDKDGIKIHRFDGLTDGEVITSGWTKRLYNELEDITPQPLLALTPVKRSEALALAKDYNDHVWNATSCNVGTTTCTDWCGKQKTIQTPSWVQVGTNKRFPYAWGGFSSISGFDSGISNCKKGGDIQTKYADGTSACGSDCAVGVDCSGFVSRLWKQTTKYGTSTIMQIATKISKSDLKPADALNDAGSHIRLFVGFRSDGKWDMVESYAGSGYWGVGYTVRTPAENDSYDAIRYNAIVDDSVPTNTPPVISHTPVTTAESGKDITITAKITDDSGKIAAATLRFKNEGESSFTAINMTDKGSGNFEATISAQSIKSSKIYYYLAAWDGESPVQTGVNRSILPEKAEDSTNPQYFVINIIQPNTPPVIIHTPVTTANKGEDIIITAKITDDSGKIQAANIKYKNEGDSIMKTINMVDKGGSIYEARILSSLITGSKIYYYIAAWDGETPVQTGRNRSILPEKAEDTIPVYFVINIVSQSVDAGIDTSHQDVYTPADTTYTDISYDTGADLISISDEANIPEIPTSQDIASENDTYVEEDIVSYEDIKKRTTDLSKLGVEEEGGCSCSLIE